MPETLFPTASPGRSGNFLYSLFHILLPAVCPVCGRLGRSACDDCLRSQLRALPVFCLECGAPCPCGVHRESPVCFSGTAYGDVNRAIVHVMKYRNARSIAVRMGRLLAETFACPAAAFLVPVPLHRGSDREYNQSELIARGVSEVWGIPVRRMLSWKPGIGRQARKQGNVSRVLPEGAISAKPSREAGASVFLIDDVYTTGNTMRAAKDAIERAGSRVAGAMVWSRSEGRDG